MQESPLAGSEAVGEGLQAPGSTPVAAPQWSSGVGREQGMPP